VIFLPFLGYFNKVNSARGMGNGVLWHFSHFLKKVMGMPDN